jgi:uroporphyrinogen decarboxylase
MTNKERLECIFSGGIPDFPPHFELAFQIEQEVFGIDLDAIKKKSFSSTKECADAYEKAYNDLQERLVEEFGHASVPALFYEPDIDKFHAISSLKKCVGDRALVFSWSDSGVYWMPTGDDIMDFVVMMYERPDEMHDNARKKCEAAKELSKKQVDAGVDFIVQNTDFGFNEGPFISPKHFSEFITPYMTEIVATIHDLGVPVILHSDGNLNEILDQIYSTGVDGYQSVDPQGHMDIKKVRETYPDWILMGNVNCSMLQGSDKEEIHKSVEYCMKYGGVGKRYIFSTSNCIFEGMPSESYRIMLKEYHEYTA